MILGMSSAAFYGMLETEAAAGHLADFEVDTCEIFLETYSEYSADFGRTLRAHLPSLHCTSVHPLGTQFEQQLFGRAKRQVEDAFRIFTGVCEAGRALGARYYVFHGPFGVHAPLKPAQIWRLQETMARMQEIAGRSGMSVLWENVHWCALRGPEDVRSVRELLPEMRFVLDVKQAHRAGVDPFDMLDAMGDRLAHVHVLDVAQNGQLCLPGEGVLDWQRLFRRLRGMDFAGSVILEPYGKQAEDEDALRRGLAFLRRRMNEAL